MPDVSVRPMTASEYDQWQHELALAYAEEQVQAGNWPVEGSYGRACREDAARPRTGPGAPGGR
jgi:hypothetical protein